MAASEEDLSRVEAIIEGRGGMKITELAVHLAENPELREIDVWGTVEELVEQGRVEEFEYTLPNMEYRAKSFLLPKGARFLSWSGLKG